MIPTGDIIGTSIDIIIFLKIKKIRKIIFSIAIPFSRHSHLNRKCQLPKTPHSNFCRIEPHMAFLVYVHMLLVAPHASIVGYHKKEVITLHSWRYSTCINMILDLTCHLVSHIIYQPTCHNTHGARCHQMTWYHVNYVKVLTIDNSLKKLTY